MVDWILYFPPLLFSAGDIENNEDIFLFEYLPSTLDQSE